PSSCPKSNCNACPQTDAPRAPLPQSSKPPRPARSATARCSFPKSMKPSASAPRKKATRLCKSHFRTLNPVMKQLMKKIILALLVCAGFAAGDPMVRAAEAAAKAPPPAPSLEQRVGSLEAYVNNGDPTAPLKDKDGKIPDGLVTPTSATSGPGHNAWQMTSAALVLFMTSSVLELFYRG